MRHILKAAVFVAHALDTSVSLAGPQERVAVAEAIVWANQHKRPGLPSDGYQAKPLESHDETDGEDSARSTQQSSHAPLIPNELHIQREEQTIQGLSDDSELKKESTTQTYRATELRLAQSDHAPGPADRSLLIPRTSLIPPHGAGSNSSMRLELPQTAIQISVPVLRAQLIIESMEGCVPCRRQKKDVQESLVPLNWDIGEHEDAQIRFVAGTEETIYPRITLFQNGKMLDRWHGYQTPSFLSQKLRAAWDSASEQTQSQLSSSSAGTIHASGRIQQTIDYMRRYIGEGNEITIVWDRSAATLNLFAAKEFTLRDVIGISGRLQVDAPNAIGIPVKSMATTYNLAGDTIFLDPERFSIAGMDRLFRSSSQFGATQPTQFAVLDDALLLYSVCQLFYAVYELLHPNADLVIPDQISLTAVLKGNDIVAEFQKGPGLCLKWIFTISPILKRVVVNDHHGRVEFEGSRFLRSRDFEVK